jgi:O-acetyl-ADP-ribose deacetylase (regulator of RNase III)
MEQLQLQVLETHEVHGLRLHVSVGSIVDFAGDAIVNAANEGCLSGGGVDGAISDAGGEALFQARLALPIVEGTRGVRCPTGEAAVTGAGGTLRCRCVIHAVGPNYYIVEDEDEGDELLRSAYTRAAELAAEQPNVRTVAFSLLSCGVFRAQRSLRAVLSIGLEAIRDVARELEEARPNGSGGDRSLTDVYLIAFTPAERKTLRAAARALFGGEQAPEEDEAAAPAPEPRGAESPPARPAEPLSPQQSPQTRLPESPPQPAEAAPARA